MVVLRLHGHVKDRRPAVGGSGEATNVVNLEPGQFVVIKPGALIRRFGCNEESYVEAHRSGMVIQQSHLWRELGNDSEPVPDYMVLASHDMRIYYVSSSHLLTPDALSDPSRLFGRLRG